MATTVNSQTTPLEFISCFDVHQDIVPFIDTRRKKLDISGGSDVNDGSEIKVSIVGQEQNGNIIFTWNDKLVHAKEGPGVTHFGLYDSATRTSKVIFVHDRKVTIANATVSQEHTFLGFVTVEQIYMSEGYGKKHSKQDMYKAFLAEILPQSRVFYLNLERTNYLKLQFLYGQYKTFSHSRESHLLVLLHKESIGLYHLPVARVGEEGVIMSGEPKKEQIFHKRFVWCQWDALGQRLYVLHFRKQGRNATGQSIYGPILTCYQFSDKTVNEFTLEVPIDLPVPLLKPSTKSHYLDLGPYQCIPDGAINLKVLVQPNGTMCICYQHQLQPPGIDSKPDKKNKSSSKSKPAGEDTVEIQYSICMVHHGKTLVCQGPSISRAKAEKTRLYFHYICDYLLVYLPGCFTHLLNVGIEYEPCHHILLHDSQSQLTGPQDGTDQADSVSDSSHWYTSFVRDRLPNLAPPALGMYSVYSQRAYRVSISRDLLQAVFQQSRQASLRAAIFHYAVLHAKDLAMAKNLLQMACTDVSNMELPLLFQEFLTGSTYVALKRQLEWGTLRLLPFTCYEIWRGQYEKGAEGEKLSRLYYTNLRALILADKRQQCDDVWDNLVKFRQGLKTEPHCRFQHNIKKQLDKMEDDWVVIIPSFMETEAEAKSSSQSFFSRLGARAKSLVTGSQTNVSTSSIVPPERLRSSTSESVLGAVPSFLKSINTESQQQQLIAKILEGFAAHLCKYRKKESRSKIRNISTEYISCQLQQSRQLCHLLWSLVVPQDDASAQRLDGPVTDKERRLFQLYERYYLATQELSFPLAPGFPAYFVSLGFKCLDFRIFLEYVDRKVLYLHPDFVAQVFLDLEDNEEGVTTKMQLISRVPKRQVLDYMKAWYHPLAQKYIIHNYADLCLKDDSGEGWDFLSTPGRHKNKKQLGASIRSPGVTIDQLGTDPIFPPLNYLMKLLEKRDPGLDHGESAGNYDVNHWYLEEYSLLHTKEHYNTDLRNVSF